MEMGMAVVTAAAMPQAIVVMIVMVMAAMEVMTVTAMEAMEVMPQAMVVMVFMVVMVAMIAMVMAVMVMDIAVMEATAMGIVMERDTAGAIDVVLMSMMLLLLPMSTAIPLSI